MLKFNEIHNTDALSGLKQLPEKTISCVTTSPPYWALRSYLNPQDPNKSLELGCEPYFKDYINNLILIFKEVHRVLRDDGCVFVNLNDTYYGAGKGSGGKSQLTSRKQVTNVGSYFEIDGTKFNNGELKSKCLCNIPYRFAIKMTDELGFIQRNQIIWYKPNAFTESCKHRFTRDFEPILFFTKNTKYDFRQQFEPFSPLTKIDEVYTGQATKDYDGQGAQNPSDSKRRILENLKNKPGRNKRCVWKINVKPSKDKHTATFNEELITPLIKAGCPENGIILDPFMGVGTSALVAKKLNRQFIGFELNKEFCDIGRQKLGIVETL